MGQLATIVVHADDLPGAGARLQLAAQLARDHGAWLVGAYFAHVPELSPQVAALIPDEVVQRRMAEALDAQKAVEAEFRAAALRAGVTRLDWTAPAGPFEWGVLRVARTCDLMVVGQPDPNEPSYDFATKVAETAVLRAGRPALFVPCAGLPQTFGTRAIIAWNGTRESARAAADALPFLQRAGAVEAITVQKHDEAPIGSQDEDARLSAWLERHGVRVSAVRREVVGDVGVAEWLLSRAADSAADLIVMGAYAHARLTERVLGGVTRKMMRSMTIPVLMSH